MYQTKKQLRLKVAALQGEVTQLKRIEKRSALIESADLPKCENKICRICAYAAFEYPQYSSNGILLGCAKHLTCKDFLPKEKIILASTNLYERGY